MTKNNPFNYYFKQELIMTKQESPILDRISKLQQHHTWMLEAEARHLLVSVYAALTQAKGLRGDELQEEMNVVTDLICTDTRENIEALLKNTGGAA